MSLQHNTLVKEPDLESALRRCAAGDRAALRVIYDREAGRMMGVALRLLRRPALAEEVVHDAFVQIWTGAPSFDPSRGGARTWIYAVLRHRALNVLRGEVRTELFEDLAPTELVGTEDDPDAAIARLSEASALRRCLDQLQPPRRHAVVLAYMHGLSHGELATRMGVPLGTVKSWLRRSLRALRECMA
jgi:RNA polymerase sigma factor (sigma-70 family)